MAKIITLLVMFCICMGLNAQDVTVFSSGMGSTKEEATKYALRNALEEAYGAFLSSSTKIVNDVLVSDEIISISQGNIKKYEVIDAYQKKEGQYIANVKSVVSLNKFSSYCQGKGMSISFNGSSLNMNLKMIEFNKENEYKTMKDVFLQIIDIQKPIYDAEIEIVNTRVSGDFIIITADITLKTNNNYKNVVGYFHKILSEISMKSTERKLYKNVGLDYEYDLYYFRNKKSMRLVELFDKTHYSSNLKKYFYSFNTMMERLFQIQIGDIAKIQTKWINGQPDSYCEGEGNCSLSEYVGLKHAFSFNSHYTLEYKVFAKSLSNISEIKIIPFCDESYETIKEHVLKKMNYIDIYGDDINYYINY